MKIVLLLLMLSSPAFPAFDAPELGGIIKATLYTPQDVTVNVSEAQSITFPQLNGTAWLAGSHVNTSARHFNLASFIWNKTITQFTDNFAFLGLYVSDKLILSTIDTTTLRNITLYDTELEVYRHIDNWSLSEGKLVVYLPYPSYISIHSNGPFRIETKNQCIIITIILIIIAIIRRLIDA